MAALWLQQMGVTPPDTYVKPASDNAPEYVELLERNVHIVYPALAVLVLVLIVAGILQAWRTHDLDGLQKAELKREVVLELRKENHGAPAEAIAKVVGLEPFKLVKLLEEMQRDGVVSSHTTSDRLTIWRLRGLTRR